jgi:hypothetical protein
MKELGKRVLGFFNSLRLTVALLILSILLIFAATLDQVHLGVWGVQEKYFRSFFIFAKMRGSDFSIPIFPGGYLLAALLLPNLLVAHFLRFRWSLSKSGIWLTHIGLILLLVGQGLSGLLQKDNQIRVDVGQTRRYSESFRETELAVIEVTRPDYDDVVAIPVSKLEGKESVQHPMLPFRIRPVAYYPNAQIRPRSQMPSPLPSLATAGVGPEIAVEPAPVTYKPDEMNFPTAYVELLAPDASLGTFLVSAMIVEPQEVTYQGRTWHLILRAERDYFPFTLTLKKFTHDIYPGTDIPKDFASTIQLKSDDKRDDREVRIFMNNPLRYGGRAFYQAGYANNDRTSVLQVVSNPSWLIPYVSCALIALGLMIEFGMHLIGFFRRRTAQARNTT